MLAMGSSRELDALRACVRSEYAQLPARDFERFVRSVISELPQDATEDFWQGLRSVGSMRRSRILSKLCVSS